MTELITIYVSGCRDCPMCSKTIYEYYNAYDCLYPNDSEVYIKTSTVGDEPITPANCPIKTQAVLILPK